MADVNWSPTNAKPDIGSLPFATHEGLLQMAGHEFRCYRISTGEIIINSDDFEAFLFGLSE